MTFGQQTTKAIDTLLSKFNKVKQETAIELYTTVVSRTPIKTGYAISKWELSVNDGIGTQHIHYRNDSENTSTGWSNQMSESLAGMFVVGARMQLGATNIGDKFILSNDAGYIFRIENGTYKGHAYFEEMPPYYVDRPTPFWLTSGGYSLKSPRGMVKLTLVDSSRVIKNIAGVYNR